MEEASICENDQEFSFVPIKLRCYFDIQIKLYFIYIYMEFGDVVPPGDINLGVVSTYSKLWNWTRSPT